MMEQATLESLPNELLLKIADYVDPVQQNPRRLLPLVYSCQRLYFALRPRLYQSIYCFISIDEHSHSYTDMETIKEQTCYSGQMLISKIDSFTKLVTLLRHRPDLLALVQHLNFQCLNFRVDDRYVSGRLIESMSHQYLNTKPINFYSQSSQLKGFTLKMFKSFIHCLENHKSLDNSKQILSENTLVNDLGEKYRNTREEAVRRMLFCPCDFTNEGNPNDLVLIKNVVQMSELAIELNRKGKDVHISVMNLQNAMEQSSFGHNVSLDEDYFMKLNVMHRYL